MAKRERSKTRADMIAMLKSRGVRGRLSKMTKAQLRNKLDETAPPPEDQEGDGRKPQRSGELELEADPQSGGHFYKADGSTSATQEAKYKHEHRKKDWPAQKGSGSSYKSFMTKEMKQNGGNMAKAAAAYRDQKGGHLVRKDGTVGAAESTKYKHTHTGENPATDSTRAPASATAKASGSTTKAKQARAERAAEQNKPKPAPKPVPKPSPKRAPKPARKKRVTASDDIFDTDEQKAAKEKARKAAQKEAEKAGARKTRRRQAKDVAEKQAADKQATERREAVKSRKAKTSDANVEKQRKAKARLKEGKSGNVFFKYRDEAFARGEFDIKQITKDYNRDKRDAATGARDKQDEADDHEFAEKELAEESAQKTAPARAAIAKAGKIPKKSKQSGSGHDDKGQMGKGHCGDQMGEGPEDRRLVWLGPKLRERDRVAGELVARVRELYDRVHELEQQQQQQPVVHAEAVAGGGGDEDRDAADDDIDETA